MTERNVQPRIGLEWGEEHNGSAAEGSTLCLEVGLFSENTL